jgi:DNA-binding MarR family transcriptional regulator
MSRESRQELLQDLINEIRRSQNAAHLVDSVTEKVLGVSQSEGMCIDVLDREGPVTAGRLAEATQLTTGAITAVIDRLEGKGYARRVRDETDRRRVLVEVTDEARRKAHELYGELGQHGREILDPLTVDEIKLIRDFTRRSSELNEEHAARLRERYGL